MLDSLSKKIFYPWFVLVSYAALFMIVGAFPDLGLQMQTSIAVGFATIFCMGAEYLQPQRKEWSKSIEGDYKFDMLCTFVTFPMVVTICKWIAAAAPNSIRVIDISALNIFLQFLICLLVGEFLFYWYHRFSHTNSFLWKFHSVHHSVKRVYWMNAGTFSIVDLGLNFSLYCLPMAFFKMNLDVIEHVVFFSAVTGLLEHANVSFSAGPLNYIFNSAELHRWHHSVVIKESQTNYGKALSIWDLIFRTFYFPKNSEVVRVGVDE